MPQHDERQKSINFVLPAEQHRRLKSLAAEHEQSLSGLIREALAEYLRRVYLIDLDSDDLSVGAWGGDRQPKRDR